MRSVLAVAVAGGVGTSARYGLETAFPPAPGAWPWTTFAINVVGSLALGILTAIAAQLAGPRGPFVRLALGTGLVGGFTTYSTYVIEADRLLAASGGLGIAYGIVSIVVGAAAALLGIRLGERIRTREAKSS